jgi:hypothetical protein
MENLEYAKETIGNIRNEMTHTWGTAFLFGGGAISCFSLEESFWKYSLIVSGFVAFLVFIYAYSVRRSQLMKYTDKLKERLR